MISTLTRFNEITADWRRVKNHCRTTDNKDFTEKDATPAFKRKLLISEHTPIRLLEFDWSWRGIKYWVGMEWARHKFEKFISSQRDDRLIDEIPRDEKPQKAFINFDGFANMQSLIDAWRKRLCRQATFEARFLAEDFKKKLRETHPDEANVLVPNCVYRMGCPEFHPCGYFQGFYYWAANHYPDGKWMTDLQTRYDVYNEFFYHNQEEV